MVTRLYPAWVFVASVTVSGRGDPDDTGGRNDEFVEFWTKELCSHIGSTFFSRTCNGRLFKPQ